MSAVLLGPVIQTAPLPSQKALSALKSCSTGGAPVNS